jgi:peroxiredoxin
VVVAWVGTGQPAIACGGATNFTLKDIKGKYLRLSDYRKKVVFLNLWTTCCSNGRKMLRHLEKLHRKYKKRGFVVLAISMDGPETRSKVVPTVKRYKLTFPVAIDKDSRVVKLYNPKRVVPFSLLLVRGKLRKTWEGFQTSDLGGMERAIRQALK